MNWAISFESSVSHLVLFYNVANRVGALAFWLAKYSTTPHKQMKTLAPIPVCPLSCTIHAK